MSKPLTVENDEGSLKEKETCDGMPNKCPISMNGPYSLLVCASIFFYSTHSQLLPYYLSFENGTGGVDIN